MNLKYKTIQMSDPKGKPKVYFSCHPDDFEEAFPIISEDLFRHANCSIWYDERFLDGFNENVDIDESEDDLKEMQLVVFAVTSKFIRHSNRARDVELPLALKNHIPVLPIMMEDGLGYEFSNTCAKIQLVSKYGNDPTAVPYDDVLQTFLDSVLVGDELAEMIRTAFDAYVFLSYRKKDRRHAQRLMRLIHENKQFRDIAIWYDEYLVPGEGFNEAIVDAFNKSSLFAMAVTPHLEEEGNYVMRIEYPMAREREEKKDDFAIVPVEMYSDEEKVNGKDWRINQSNLKGKKDFKYQEIENLQDEHRPAEMNDSFIKALERIAKTENDSSARHRFFIGLAYLNGIDMEVNHKKALELLESAARDPAPCMESTAKLADMYRNGDGVEINLAKAIEWQELLSLQYKTAYIENHDPDQHKGYGTAYFKALNKLSDMEREAGNFDVAISSAKAALLFCGKLETEVGVREKDRDKAVVLNRLGSLYKEMGNLTAARDHYREAAKIYAKQASEISTKRVRRDLSISYEKLGDLCREEDMLNDAEKYYLTAKDIRTELAVSEPSTQSRRDLSCILTKLGNVYKSRKEYVGAARCYQEALAMDRVLAEEVKSLQAWDDFGISFVKLADIHKAEGRWKEAEDHYTRACEIFRKNVEKTDSLFYLDHLAGGCEKLAGIKKKTGQKKEAEALYKEGVNIREQLYKEGKTVSNAHSLAASCYNAALFLKDKAMMKQAYEIWDILCKTYPEYIKYRDKAKTYL